MLVIYAETPMQNFNSLWVGLGPVCRQSFNETLYGFPFALQLKAITRVIAEAFNTA